MAASILVLNAGSSSLKFCLYGSEPYADLSLALRGQVAGLGTAPRLRVADGAGVTLVDERHPDVGEGGAAALQAVLDWLLAAGHLATVAGVGHRVVHGGATHPGPVLVTPAVMHELRELVPLAPLHQPFNLEAIETVAARLPAVPQVACFDTSFHHGRPAVAEVVPVPAWIRAAGVQRYGFHGLSYAYVAAVLPEVAPALAEGRVIVAHLGSGASLCALRNGRSVDTTMGFSALDGLCMGTRPGSIDAGAVLFLVQQLGMTVADVERLLYRESGLLGISGISADMRTLLASAEPAAQLAVEYFVYRAAREIGSLAAVLGGIDGLVFTGGIGENSPEIRARICAASRWLGVEIDPAANAQGAPLITVMGSGVPAWIIPANEELVIARATATLLGPGRPGP